MSIEIEVSIRSRGKPVVMDFSCLEEASAAASIIRQKGIRVVIEQDVDERFTVKLAA